MWKRRLPIGAEVVPGEGAIFRAWAPGQQKVEVKLVCGPGSPLVAALDAVGDGYFEGFAAGAASGSRYVFRLGGEDGVDLPDLASRFQPEGLGGPSQIVDPSAMRWTDSDWQGIRSTQGQVLYELHVGTFTTEGTWAAAAERLADLADLGVTVLEIMPIAEFKGRFGWGYDGVLWFAPFHGYGTPDDFRHFVNRAHALGLAVILDVVYNHIGFGGEIYRRYSDEFYSTRHKTDWGEPPNFDGPGCEGVRSLVLANLAYWIDEFHLDGVRIDATQCLYDTSSDHILGAMSRRLHETAAQRQILVVGECETQHARLLRDPDCEGLGLDMLWSDDFHHAARVATTGFREGYYADYTGSPQELISATKRGWLYQGQWNVRQKKRRGSLALGIPPSAFVHFLQNHDQIANSAAGKRLHELTTPGRLRAATALLLLAPGTPMLFQGQEFAASSPFLFFADHERSIAEAVHRGRREFLKQFPSLATPEIQARLPYPNRDSFERSRIDWNERTLGFHAEMLLLHRDLLRLRREDATIRGGCRPGAVDGAVLGPEALVLRWLDPEGQGDDRLMLVNLGVELYLPVAAEPLLAPPEGERWQLLWSSESPRYGGIGTVEPETEEHNWRLPPHSVIVTMPAPSANDERRDPPGSA